MCQGIVKSARSTQQIAILDLPLLISEGTGTQKRRFGLGDVPASQICQPQQPPFGSTVRERITEKRDNRRILTHVEGVSGNDMSGFLHLHGFLTNIMA